MATQRTFTRQTYGKNPQTLYRWSTTLGPQDKLKTKSTVVKGCDALPNSQGEDWTNGYVYEVVVVDGQVKKLAYVACDYVA
jgi:hypothetical protein